MEGPTPVSALLHSCTLVMAGIFTYYRWHDYNLTFNVALTIFALFTTYYAFPECELKRIIAFSTVSFVSVLWTLICLYSENACLLLGIIHAVYKSTLFILIGTLMSYHYGATSSTHLKRKYISVFLLVLWFATAPTGSVYANAKHIGLHISFEVSAELQVLLVCCIPIIMWIVQIKLFSNLGFKDTYNFVVSITIFLLVYSYCLFVISNDMSLGTLNSSLQLIIIIGLTLVIIHLGVNKIYGSISWNIPYDYYGNAFLFLYVYIRNVSQYLLVSSLSVKYMVPVTMTGLVFLFEI